MYTYHVTTPQYLSLQMAKPQPCGTSWCERQGQEIHQAPPGRLREKMFDDESWIYDYLLQILIGNDKKKFNKAW